MNEAIKEAVPIVLALSIPSLMVIIGILVNKNDANRLDGRITALESKMDARFNATDAKIDRLSEVIHQGILNLNIKAGEDDTRISLLEAKTKP
jgi:hypothetical protein